MKSIRKILALALVFCMVLGLGTAAFAEEKVTLSLWACNSMMSAEEMKIPEEEWYISAAIKRFEEAHPGVTIEISAYDDNAQVLNDFKAATLAGYGPDIVCFMNGPVLLDIAAGLLPLNDYLDADHLDNLVGWETCAEDMDASKTIYGIPYAGQSVACFAYNRELIAQAGLDFDANPPRTIDEFYAALDAIRDAGILPFHLDESYPALLLYGLGVWWEQLSGTDGIIAHTLGDAKYVDDEGFLFMLEEYRKFYENEWINSDTATSADNYNVFLQGGCALCTFGIWDQATFEEAMGDNFGILPVPTAIEEDIDKLTAVGGIGACLGIANFSKHPDIAAEFAMFLTTRDEMVQYYTTNPSVPARVDITAADIGMGDNENFAKMIEMASGIYFWPDNCMSSDAANLYYTFPCQVLVGNMTPMELAEMLDEAQED